MSDRPDEGALAAALGEPFPIEAVKFKPGVVNGNRAMALAYLDARAIQDRLDEVVGVLGWQDEYEVLADGAVVCRLKIRLGGEWVTKMDVGSESEQPDEGDRRKAAFSDALKRAAVKFGIGRYLYRLGPQWVDYDAQKRRFARPPTLPAQFLPGTKKAAPAANGKAPAANGKAPAADRELEGLRRDLFSACLPADAKAPAKAALWRELLAAHHVDSASRLTAPQREALLAEMRRRIDQAHAGARPDPGKQERARAAHAEAEQKVAGKRPAKKT